MGSESSEGLALALYPLGRRATKEASGRRPNLNDIRTPVPEVDWFRPPEDRDLREWLRSRTVVGSENEWLGAGNAPRIDPDPIRRVPHPFTRYPDELAEEVLADILASRAMREALERRIARGERDDRAHGVPEPDPDEKPSDEEPPASRS
jgi:hypothetical protein